MLVRGFVGEGEKLRMPYPSYVLYRTLADIQGASWDQINFNDDWTLPGSFTESTENLKLALLPNPNSPSGTILSESEVAKVAEELECPLVVDEAYADFAETNCLGLVEQNENVLVTRTLSKSYGLQEYDSDFWWLNLRWANYQRSKIVTTVTRFRLPQPQPR